MHLEAVIETDCNYLPNLARLYAKDVRRDE